MCAVFRLSEDEWARSSGKVSVLVKEPLSDRIMAGILVLSPGQRLPVEGLSVHEESDELAYVVKGDAVFGTEEGEIRLREGDLLFNPRGTKHYIENVGEEECRVVWALSPPIKL